MIAGMGTGAAAGRGIESPTVSIGGLELEKSLERTEVWSKCARGDRGVAKPPASSSHSHCACMVSSLLLAAVFRGVIGAAPSPVTLGFMAAQKRIGHWAETEFGPYVV
eukprot:CAMPEP_0173059330 /NCGR_PEP_ID=MMETSP1102-20130122/1906_1 /TAXON_ID=49646 /ORGANISM="Geminigera sp., Strain Caron Lab Isolate" /LENGTH=107 /DNA_ID=CAMNT_0013925285 /DNA_START=240 /DNA_END=562 /DNA_ORIENTATION=-